MALTSFQICSTQQSVANLTENNNNKNTRINTKNANIYLSGSISSAVAVAVFEHECVFFFLHFLRDEILFLFRKMIRFKRKFSKTYHMTVFRHCILMLKIKFAVGLRLKKELKNDIYIEKKKDKTHWIVRHETDNYEKLKKNTHTHSQHNFAHLIWER